MDTVNDAGPAVFTATAPPQRDNDNTGDAAEADHEGSAAPLIATERDGFPAGPVSGLVVPRTPLRAAGLPASAQGLVPACTVTRPRFVASLAFGVPVQVGRIPARMLRHAGRPVAIFGARFTLSGSCARRFKVRS